MKTRKVTIQGIELIEETDNEGMVILYKPHPLMTEGEMPQLFTWISVKDKLPEESEKGTPVLVNLSTPKIRVYGNIVISIFYKGKFHKDFNKGYIQTVFHWMPFPKPPKE